MVKWIRRAVLFVALAAVWIVLRAAPPVRTRVRRARAPPRRIEHETTTRRSRPAELHVLNVLGGAKHSVPGQRESLQRSREEEFVMFGSKLSELSHDSGRLHTLGVDTLSRGARIKHVVSISEKIANPCEIYPKADCSLLPSFAWAKSVPRDDAAREQYLEKYAAMDIADRYLFAVGVLARKTLDKTAKTNRLREEIAQNLCILLQKVSGDTDVEQLLRNYASNGPRWLDTRFPMPRDRPPVRTLVKIPASIFLLSRVWFTLLCVVFSSTLRDAMDKQKPAWGRAWVRQGAHSAVAHLSKTDI